MIETLNTFSRFEETRSPGSKHFTSTIIVDGGNCTPTFPYDLRLVRHVTDHTSFTSYLLSIGNK